MQDQSSSSSNTESGNKGCQGLMWWTTLIVAVLAVPSFGIIIASIVPIKGIGEIIVFMLACWFCTFLGMKLMQTPGMNERVGNKKN